MSPPCKCPACQPENPAPTYTRAWALECEARWVLAMPFNDRAPYLVEIAKKRGEAGREALSAEISRIWKAGRGA